MNAEMLEAMQALAVDKGISVDKLFAVLADALESAYKKMPDAHEYAWVTINPETMEYRVMAQELDEDLEPIGEEFDVTPDNFGRIAAVTTKQVLTQRIREEEREQKYEEYAGREGDIVTGIIQQSDSRYTLLDLGRVEALLPRAEQVPNERPDSNTRIKAYIVEVRKTAKGPQIVVSRTHPGLIKRLFELEVPEIADGIVEIRSCAREPGHRTKIAVWSNDPNVDPVGACVGMRGSRVQTIVNELHGEKIDIIKWTEDLPTLISESLSPAEIQRVLIDQENKRIDIILSEENLSKAIGRRGQNVRLASKLTNFEIDILTEKEDSERRQAEFKDRTETLIKNLEVDETLGQLLVSEGFISIEEIAQSNPDDISKIDAIDDETAIELINRSKETIAKEKEAVSLKLKELGVEEKLINLKGMTQGMLVILGQKNIKKLSDFADLSSDELIGGYDEIKGKKIRIDGYLEEFSLSRKEADDLIMSAREIVYK